ncbi:MAG: bacterial ammonia monooxygenase, subunit AmoB [Cycloclasticus sp.]
MFKLSKMIEKLVLSMMLVVITGVAFAHGERNQEPFLRMKTLHWYDAKWSVENGSTIQVNEEVTLTGKVHFFSSWPEVIKGPSTIFLANATPGPVFVRKASYLNEVPMIQSTGAELGHTYEYKVILKARIPGKHHVHPMINVESAGGLVGPGIWITIDGEADDFVYSVTTRTGQVIDNLGSYAVQNVVNWHLFWAAVAVFWLFWWIRRPLLVVRFLKVKEGSWNELITKNDKFLGAFMIVFIIGVLIYANSIAKEKYPRTIPLQAGKVDLMSLAAHNDGLGTVRAKQGNNDASVGVISKKAEYFLPGRTVTVEAEITNNSRLPIQLGEFTAANIRFINHDVDYAMKGVDEGYPDELVADKSLGVSDNTPIQPGESRLIKINATDVAWETERLSSLMNDPESSYGALLFFFDSEGNRMISELSGQILPTFVD